MQLLSIELNNIRNYNQCSISFNKNQNIISGNNAQGKSNLLEAIYLLCISRSFRTHYEKEIIQFQKNFCTIIGKFSLDNGFIKTVCYAYSNEEGKNIAVDRKRVNKLSEHIGQFPIVLSSPEEYNLTSGPPAERRKYIDIVLSQIRLKYLHYLQDYQRILKQRNTLLADWKNNIESVLEPWDEELTHIGSQIIVERFNFLERFTILVKEAYKKLTQLDENIDIVYQSICKPSELVTINYLFKKKLHELKRLEQVRKTTLIGPHRDDFIFYINGKELRKYGSRGQHKTFLIALMVAEYQIIKEAIAETPIIIIDDLFSEIDSIREKQIMNHLLGLGQKFITTTYDLNTLKREPFANTDYFQVKNGTIEVI
jgi:DNA replication and repair protein RecF